MQRNAPYRPPSPDDRLPAADASDDFDRCPFLGIPAGADTSLVHPSDANLCLRAGLPIPISTIHQENYCLTSRYESCPVYQAHGARTAAGGERLLPLTAVGVAGSDAPPAWAIPVPSAAAPMAEPAIGASLAAPPTAMPAAKSPLLFPWEEPAHPDFQADIAAASARRQQRHLDIRPVLIGLLLLALIPLMWWAWTTVRPDSNGTGEAADGAGIILPTSAITGADSAGDGVGAGGSPPGATTTPEDNSAGGIAMMPATTPGPTAPEATATLTDLEKIAITATALFMNATAAPECAAPAWWVSYRVEEGDTIEALATTRGISPEEMIAANCLTGSDLTPGAMLLLPPVGLIAILPVQPTATPQPTTTTVPTRVTRQPTRSPIPFPTFTFPIIISTSTPWPQATEPSNLPTDEPGEQPTRRPTTAPATATPPNPFATATPPTSTSPTATSPNPFATATSPNPFATATPPRPIGTATPPSFVTMTPPGIGNGTVTPTRGAVTMTPPAP